jgi:hypothetical protein
MNKYEEPIIKPDLQVRNDYEFYLPKILIEKSVSSIGNFPDNGPDGQEIQTNNNEEEDS